MNIIFLDIDGVLVTSSSIASIDKYKTESSIIIPINDVRHIETVDENCLNNFRSLLTQLDDVMIVISSSWRKLYKRIQFCEFFSYWGLPPKIVLDITPSSNHGERGLEILEWLEKTSYKDEIDSYIVIDDSTSDILPHIKEENFVNTSWQNGFEEHHIEEVLRKFSTK